MYRHLNKECLTALFHCFHDLQSHIGIQIQRQDMHKLKKSYLQLYSLVKSLISIPLVELYMSNLITNH